MSVPTSWWIYFNLFVGVLILLDLVVLNRRAHQVSLKEAIWLSIFWVVLALIFNGVLYFIWPDPDPHARNKATLDFFTGYVIERALSIDNIFVFVVLFSYFKVPPERHRSVLFWGIIGAMIFRAAFIFAGTAIINRFHWALYVFGGFLVITGIKMAFADGDEVHPEKNPVLRLLRRFLPVTHDYFGGRFFVRIDGKLLATPLLIVLLVVETTDIVFALDSIPAILGITTNAFIVYSSNIFAIFGLRALYFVLAGAMDVFHYLSYGLSAVLVFIGVKMLLEIFDKKISTGWALGVVGLLLGVSIVASLMNPKPPAPPND
ncbi:MAG: TerC family protein [Planctomycetes bacterium]|nr:TerC family protein [Planctomycetota bacterium]MBI3835768.1 TerC family protein [Planctomycetota bacterium]